MQSKRATQFLRVAQWHNHVNALGASVEMRDWLTNRASLTARLVAGCQQFRVQRLHQKLAICLADEFAEIGLPRPRKALEREVLLRCDGVAMVYAHTVVPLTASASQWPLFAALGEKSLGTTLFNDPLVERCALSYAKLRPDHVLMQRIQQLQLLPECSVGLLARRSVFRRKGACLLVTEVFLPPVEFLRK
ncbi:chorismate--pyruvate lyase family protein [Undibacterium sp. Ren11W]